MTLEEVVVIARKRSERLQDVPVAVTAMGQDQVKGLGAKTLENIVRTGGAALLVRAFGLTLLSTRRFREADLLDHYLSMRVLPSVLQGRMAQECSEGVLCR